MIASRVRLVLLVWLLALLASVSAVLTAMTGLRAATAWEEVVLFVGLGLGFTTIGVVLVIRRPAEPVGRQALLIGVVAIAALGLRSASIVLDGLASPIPTVGALAATLSLQLWNAVVVGGGMLLVRFPAGRERDRLSAIADALFVAGVACVAIVLFAPGEITSSGIRTAANPLGIEGFGRGTAEAIANLGLAFYVAGLAATAAVLARRHARSGPVVRAQIRWVAAAGVLPIVLLPGLFFGPAWLWSVWFLSFVLLPVAIGVAILRYRLYDIDRIVSRTIGWAVVSGLLLAAFGVTIVGLQALLAPFTNNNTLAVAGSTLAAAALFQPLRVRVQLAVDRRFNRARVDAQRAIDTFEVQLRDEVDVGALQVRLLGAVNETVKPDRMALWIRSKAAVGR